MSANASLRPPLGLTIAWLVLLGLFLSAFAAALASMYEGWQSHSWQEVPGRITDQHSERARSKRGQTNQQRRDRAVYLHLAYSYQVDGVDYEGDRIEPGTFGMISAANQRAYADRFPVGSEVSVYVDPQDPQRAVLVRGWSFVTTFLCAISAFLGVGSWIIHVLRKHWRQAPTPQAARRGRLP